MLVMVSIDTKQMFVGRHLGGGHQHVSSECSVASQPSCAAKKPADKDQCNVIAAGFDKCFLTSTVRFGKECIDLSDFLMNLIFGIEFQQLSCSGDTETKPLLEHTNAIYVTVSWTNINITMTRLGFITQTSVLLRLSVYRDHVKTFLRQCFMLQASHMQLVPRPLRRSQNHGHRVVTNGYKRVLINSTGFVDWAGLSVSVFAFSLTLVFLISLFLWNETRRHLGNPDRCCRRVTSMLMLMLFWKKFSFLLPYLTA